MLNVGCEQSFNPEKLRAGNRVLSKRLEIEIMRLRNMDSPRRAIMSVWEYYYVP